jgi:hypothetical protein
VNDSDVTSHEDGAGFPGPLTRRTVISPHLLMLSIAVLVGVGG